VGPTSWQEGYGSHTFLITIVSQLAKSHQFSLRNSQYEPFLVSFPFRIRVKHERIFRCPRCGGPDPGPSYSNGFRDSLMMLLGREPFRCRSCQHRFYRRPPDEPKRKGADHAETAKD
jgi:hypothetical protein